MSQAKKIVLIDGHSILNRAFFGVPELTNSEGLHTNAVYGFLNMMFKILDEEKPDYLTVAFDVSAPTFRHKMYAPYKGTRKPMAPELKEQVPVMKDMLRAMHVRIVEKEGYEADDVLGTIAKECEKKGLEVSLVSGDRDLLQLASEHIQIRIPKTKRTGTEIENYYAADVKERYLVTPTEFIDVKALMGDASDNIPGVPGIGEKTATGLIAQYKSIENAYAHVDEIKPNRAKENLKTYYDQAVLSKTLATIDVHAPIDYAYEEAVYQNPYTEEAFLLCKKLEFKNLLTKFQIETPKEKIAEKFTLVLNLDKAKQVLDALSEEPAIGAVWITEDRKALGVAVAGKEQAYFLKISDELSQDDLAKSIGDAHTQGDSAGYTDGAHTQDDLAKHVDGAITQDYLANRLDEAKKIITYGLKEQLSFFLDTNSAHYFDVKIAAYLLNPLKNAYPYEDIAKDYLGSFFPSETDLLGKMTKKQALLEKPEAFVSYACYLAYTCAQSYAHLENALKEKQMEALFSEIEMPLIFTLYDMEKIGIRMDADALKSYGERLSVRIAELEKQIFEAAGTEFNINSPKQLGEILFEKLALPGGKKTKTGYSTAADVLEKMAPDAPIVADVLEYRGLAKLKSTYADGLSHCVAEDGRVHSTFHQTITATGRISSADPNLQNIPIRMPLGREIRKVFLPEEGFVFLDADYSQIELRVLAHLSGDERLIEAYRNAEDIHRMTASQVFHVPFEEVTELQRRNAKAVNFGIVYGISSFGLSQDLSISKKEAAAYMERYFEAYPVMHAYLTGLVEQAKNDGFVRTMFGRLRPIPELRSSNFMQRSFGERVAMNSPIQGSAADIIKIAMIRVHDKLKETNKKSRLILQVHDELLLEVAKDELEEVSALLREEMEHATDLKVKLEVDMHTGNNWYEAK